MLLPLLLRLLLRFRASDYVARRSHELIRMCRVWMHSTPTSSSERADGHAGLRELLLDCPRVVNSLKASRTAESS